MIADTCSDRTFPRSSRVFGISRACLDKGIDAFIDLIGPQYVQLAVGPGGAARSHRNDHLA